MPSDTVVQWEAAREIFDWDGSWRDLYAFETTAEHWDLVLRALRTAPFQVELTTDGQPTSLSDSLAGFFTSDIERPSALLSVVIDGVRMNAHMFVADEIEFDLDPREVAGEREFAAVVRFMNFIADVTSKSVVLTPENCPQQPLLIATPGTNGVLRT